MKYTLIFKFTKFSPNSNVYLSVVLMKGGEIYHQLRKRGASLDWNRACFTMDPVIIQFSHGLFGIAFFYDIQSVLLCTVCLYLYE